MQTYYINDPDLQESVKYTEDALKAKVGEQTLLYYGALVGAASGNDFVAAITSNFQLKGNLKWHTAGLNYSYKF